MQRLFFYLAYPFVYLLASLPFPLLYAVSDVFYYLVRLSGYRRKVVMKNLRKSFPEKNEAEIRRIASAFYHHLCDLTLETLKMKTITEREVRERIPLNAPDWMYHLAEKKRSVILVLPHYANWEWAAPAFNLQTPMQLVVVYKQLSNPYFDSMMRDIRVRFGTQITPMASTLRQLVANRDLVTATALVADQAASKKDAYWMEFLHQDTAVFMGPEKLSKKFDYPIVYVNMRKVKRGYYAIELELLVENPREATEGEITQIFTRRFEEKIRHEPTVWLWSHKRWKHKRPVAAKGTK